MHTYEKRYVDAQGSYEIWQMRIDGSQRKVDEDYHGYVEWLALGNMPSEIVYVAPPEPDTKMILQQELIATDSWMARIAEDIYDLLVADGKTFPQTVIDKIAERKSLRNQIVLNGGD